MKSHFRKNIWLLTATGAASSYVFKTSLPIIFCELDNTQYGPSIQYCKKSGKLKITNTRYKVIDNMFLKKYYIK